MAYRPRQPRSERKLEQGQRFRKDGNAAARAARDPEGSKSRLIEATLDAIVEDGIAGTTVSRIVSRAGLSRGLIHLHFGGKDNLLAAAAQAFSSTYYAELDRQLAGIPDEPAATLLAIIRADLGEAMLNERSVAIWHAFRGVARTNPTITRFSTTRDARLRRLIFDATLALLDAGPQDQAARLAAKEISLGVLALLEGMWTDFITHPGSFSRDAAIRIVLRFLEAMFPGRFAG